MNINIIETGNVSANCNACTIDKAFFIPLELFDPVLIRVQIPYAEYVLNGTFPTLSSINITDESGTFFYGNVNLTTGTKWGFAHDSNNKIIEYQFLFPLPFRHNPSLINSFCTLYTTPILNVGDVVEYTRMNGDNVMFIYGLDVLPDWFIEINNGILMFSDVDYTSLTMMQLRINGILVTPTLLLGHGAPLTLYDGKCFRYRFEFDFNTSGRTYVAYTKPYKIVGCNESTTLIEGYYPLQTTDCALHFHQCSWDLSNIQNYLRYRVYGDLQGNPNRVKKSYNSKFFTFKTEYKKRYNLITELMPEWYANEIECAMSGNKLLVNRKELYIEDTEVISDFEDLPTQYKKINISLSSSKCEIVFSC